MQGSGKLPLVTAAAATTGIVAWPPHVTLLRLEASNCPLILTGETRTGTTRSLTPYWPSPWLTATGASKLSRQSPARSHMLRHTVISDNFIEMPNRHLFVLQHPVIN